MMVEALYGCQFADCAVDVSCPAHMLKMLNGAPVCEDCVDDMGKVDWLDLEKFVPPEQAKITDLQAKLELEQAKVKILKGYTLGCGCDGAYDSGCPICTKERLEEEAIALITAKSERDE